MNDAFETVESSTISVCPRKREALRYRPVRDRTGTRWLFSENISIPDGERIKALKLSAILTGNRDLPKTLSPN